MRFMCPKLDRYWYHDYAKKIFEVKKNQNTLDLFVDERRTRTFDDPYTKAMNKGTSNYIPPPSQLNHPSMIT